jgi:hypothetical protein
MVEVWLPNTAFPILLLKQGRILTRAGRELGRYGAGQVRDSRGRPLALVRGVWVFTPFGGEIARLAEQVITTPTGRQLGVALGTPDSERPYGAAALALFDPRNAPPQPAPNEQAQDTPGDEDKDSDANCAQSADGGSAIEDGESS